RLRALAGDDRRAGRARGGPQLRHRHGGPRQRRGVLPGNPRRPVLVVRRDDRVGGPGHWGAGMRRDRQRHRRHGLHPGARPGARRRALPVPEGGRPRAPGSGAARRDRRYAAARPPTRPPARGGHRMSAGHHLVDAITEPGRPETQEVADGVFAYIQPDGTWWINNTGCLVGPQGVISIDACSTERRTRAYRQAIEAVTAAPVRTLVNTHHHGDHTFGNCLFPGATIVGHERAREEAIGLGPPRDLPFWAPGQRGEPTLHPPVLTVTPSR